MLVFWQTSSRQESVFNLLKTFFICFLLSGREQVQCSSHISGHLSPLAQGQESSETSSEEQEALFPLVGGTHHLYSPWLR